MDDVDRLAQAVIDRNASRGIMTPARPWASYQTWNNLLLCHWPVDPAIVRPKIPPELDIDTYDGSAWVSLLPMLMGQLRLRELFIPGERSFPELNFRTYVQHGGRAGVYFFRIDCDALLADFGARLFFHTPYAPAHVEFATLPDGGFSFKSRRALAEQPAAFDADYQPRGTGVIYPAESLTAFLSERYSAFAKTLSGSIVRGDLIHDPWLIQEVDAEIHQNTVLSSAGFDLPPTAPVMHYAPGVEVVLWTFEEVMQV